MTLRDPDPARDKGAAEAVSDEHDRAAGTGDRSVKRLSPALGVRRGPVRLLDDAESGVL